MKKLLVVMMAVVAITGLIAGTALAAGPNDKLIVMDATGTNPVFVVQNTGLTGIGTANPLSKLSVTDQATTANRGFMGSQNTSDAASAALILRKSRGTEAVPSLLSNGDFIGTFQFRAYDGTTYLRNGFVGAKVNGTVTTGSVPIDIFFAASATDTSDPFATGAVRMVLSSTGNVGVGTTSPSRLFSVGTGGAGSDGSTWFTSSSREYKDNIRVLSADKAMETVKNMTPVTFVYKNIPEYNHVGFIAEDVPDLVATPDRKTLSTMDIVAVLTKVVQEQNKIIAELSDKMKKLEAQVTKIKSRDMFGSADPIKTFGN